MSEPRIDEGRSSTRPVLFNGEDYDSWKSAMCSYLSGENIGVWEITTEEGWVRPSKVIDGISVYTARADYTPTEKERFAWNNKAINVLHSSLSKAMFSLISHCKTAKDIWECLRVTYEGTTIVRNAKELLPYIPYNENKPNRPDNKEISLKNTQCFECKGYGHRDVDCANNQYKTNKNFVGLWDACSVDEPEDSSNNDNNVTSTAFTTTIDFNDVQLDISHLPVPLNENIDAIETANVYSKEELFEDFETLRKLSEKLLSQNSSLKGIVEHLESENKRLNDQVLTFVKDLKKTNDFLSMFNKSSHVLDKAVSLGNSPMDKSGLGSCFISGNDKGTPSKSTSDDLKISLNNSCLENPFVLIDDKIVPITSEFKSDSKFRASDSKGLLPIPKGSSSMMPSPKMSAFPAFPYSRKTVPNDYNFGRKVHLGLPRKHRLFECSYCKKVGHTVDYCFALQETNLTNELQRLRTLKDRNRYTGSKRGPAKRKRSQIRAEWRPKGKMANDPPKVQIHPKRGTNKIWFKTREDMNYYLDDYFDRRERAHGARYY